jgi:hypothetical protein
VLGPTLSLLGLVRHLAGVERIWFRKVLAGQDATPPWRMTFHAENAFFISGIADTIATIARRETARAATRWMGGSTGG